MPHVVPVTVGAGKDWTEAVLDWVLSVEEELSTAELMEREVEGEMEVLLSAPRDVLVAWAEIRGTRARVERRKHLDIMVDEWMNG